MVQRCRGGRNLVAAAPAATTVADIDPQTVPKGMSDEAIRRKYGDRGVFITSNHLDFTLDEAPDPFERGMILVPNGADEYRLARAVERVLMTWRKQHGAAPVQHRIARSDL